ncbi:hypothetical protein BDV23DRAFT_162675 [Aspergillus alliaceus]|uniref:Uncharacterized protein n=1 Tax=Petromyces alliaceus TaxID=209559 RepID=A0A5N7BXZ4_PETAA|nr:hypothetical protein BDV23DRAFT_162675 [Aspergillus alliaceus]
MVSTSGSFNHDFRTETWCLYTVGICLTLTRLISQIKRLGIRSLQADDWLIMTTIPWYTMLVASINEIIFGRGSNYMTSQEIAGLTPEAYEARVSGSKWVLVSEEMMVLTVWTYRV